MNYVRKGAAAAAFIAMVGGVAVAQPMPAQTFPFKSGPVTITSCSVNEDKSNSTVAGNSLRINYFPNVAGRKLTSITFRVRYAGSPVTVTDTGSFDYNAPITHQFNQLGGHAWAGAAPEICRVLTATFDNGEVVNPPFGRHGMGGAMQPGQPGMMPPGANGAPGADDDSGAGPPPPGSPGQPPAPAPNASGGAVPAPAPAAT